MRLLTVVPVLLSLSQVCSAAEVEYESDCEYTVVNAGGEVASESVVADSSHGFVAITNEPKSDETIPTSQTVPGVDPMKPTKTWYGFIYALVVGSDKTSLNAPAVSTPSTTEEPSVENAISLNVDEKPTTDTAAPLNVDEKPTIDTAAPLNVEEKPTIDTAAPLIVATEESYNDALLRCACKNDAPGFFRLLDEAENFRIFARELLIGAAMNNAPQVLAEVVRRKDDPQFTWDVVTISNETSPAPSNFEAAMHAALLKAAELNNENAVKLLLSHGANVATNDFEAIGAAVQNGRKRVFAMLMEKCGANRPSIDALMTHAVMGKSIVSVKNLLNMAKTENRPVSDFLVLAARSGSVEIVKLAAANNKDRLFDDEVFDAALASKNSDTIRHVSNQYGMGRVSEKFMNSIESGSVEVVSILVRMFQKSLPIVEGMVKAVELNSLAVIVAMLDNGVGANIDSCNVLTRALLRNDEAMATLFLNRLDRIDCKVLSKIVENLGRDGALVSLRLLTQKFHSVDRFPMETVKQIAARNNDVALNRVLQEINGSKTKTIKVARTA